MAPPPRDRVAGTLDNVRLTLCLRKRGQQHGGENGNDRDDNQQFDQRKGRDFKRAFLDDVMGSWSSAAMMNGLARLSNHFLQPISFVLLGRDGFMVPLHMR